MKKIYNGVGTLKDIKEIILKISSNFTGIIFIDDNVLIYNNSKLTNCIDKWGNNKKNIKEIFNNLPDIFKIEIIEHKDYNNLFEIVKSKNKYITNISIENNNSNNIDNNNTTIINTNDDKNNKNTEINGIIINSYNEIYNYINNRKHILNLTSKKYKSDKGIILFENSKEVCFAYISKNKTIVGSKAYRKIKTLFAVSDVNIEINELDELTFNNYIKKYSDKDKKDKSENITFEELINKIKKNSKLETVKNKTLVEVITKETTLIQIKDNIYLICNDYQPIYAFYKDYDGNKAYKHIKNLCILEDIIFNIYKIDEGDFNKFKKFINNKISQ